MTPDPKKMTIEEVNIPDECAPVCSKCECHGKLKKHTVGCLTLFLCEECHPAK